MNDILSPSSNYLWDIFSFLSACGFWTIYFESSVTSMVPTSPSPVYAICLCVKSFDTILISLQTVVAKWCQTFHHQVDLPACSVELKCVSVHFKWPCWSLRCLVKPVKMACLPSPGSYRCRKSIICLGCNLHNYVKCQPTNPGAWYHSKYPIVVLAELEWPACCWSLAAWYHDLSSWPLCYRSLMALLWCPHSHTCLSLSVLALCVCTHGIPHLGNPDRGLAQALSFMALFQHTSWPSAVTGSQVIGLSGSNSKRRVAHFLPPMLLFVPLLPE